MDRRRFFIKKKYAVLLKQTLKSIKFCLYNVGHRVKGEKQYNGPFTIKLYTRAHTNLY